MMSKLVDAINKMSTGTCMKINGQGHSLTLVQARSDENRLLLQCM